MQSMIAAEREEEKQAGIRPEEGMEFEAFVLNEMCQFTGAFCNSLHCDELGHLCRVPYWLCPQKAEDPGWKNRLEVIRKEESLPERDDYLCGAGGCGLCALYRLQKAGITHLKLVGRGNHSEDMKADIQNLHKSLTILKTAGSEAEYCRQMKQQIFPAGCSRQCYYR